MKPLTRSLRQKTVLAVSLTLVALVGVLALACRVIILDTCRSAEQNMGQRALRRVRNHLKESVKRVGAISQSWSSGDEAQSLVRFPVNSSEKPQLSCKSFGELRIDSVVYRNALGQVVYSQGCNRKTSSPTPVSQGLLQLFDPQSPQYQGKPLAAPLEGLLRLSDGVLLFSERPIVDPRGQLLGSVFIGQYLDQKVIDQISSITVLDVSVLPVDKSFQTSEYHQARHALIEEARGFFLYPIDSQTIASYGLVEDVFGKPLFLLRVQYPRDTYIQAQADIKKFLLFLLISGIGTGAFVLFALERGVLSRLLRLSAAVQRVGQTQDLTLQVEVQGQDELTALQKSFNHTLQQLAHSHSILRSALGTTTSGVLITDLDASVLGFNQQYLDVFGWTPEELALPLESRLLLLAQKPGSSQQMVEKLRYWYQNPEESGTDSWDLHDGRVVEVCTEPLRLDGSLGQIVGRLWDVRDTTEHKRLEKLLRHQVSEQKVLRSIALAGAEATSLEELAEQTALLISQTLFSGTIVSVGLLEPTLRMIAVYSSDGTAPQRLIRRPRAQCQGLSDKSQELRGCLSLPNNESVPEACRTSPKTRSTLCVPIKVHGGTEGFIKVESTRRKAFGQTDRELLMTLSGQFTTALEKVRMFVELQRLACTDGLTGLSTRRHFFDQAQKELDRAKRYGRPLSVLMVDIDHFKSINDTYGHGTGDLVLKKTAQYLKEHLRTADLIGRYGGEEFAMVLPEASLESAQQAAERMRQSLEKLHQLEPSVPVKVTASIGVASLQASSSTLEALLQCADKALYHAKKGGRNCVKLWGPWAECLTDAEQLAQRVA